MRRTDHQYDETHFLSSLIINSPPSNDKRTHVYCFHKRDEQNLMSIMSRSYGHYIQENSQ